MNFPLPLSISYFSGRETGSGCGPKSSTSLSSLLGDSRVTSLGGINYIVSVQNVSQCGIDMVIDANFNGTAVISVVEY